MATNAANENDVKYAFPQCHRSVSSAFFIVHSLLGIPHFSTSDCDLFYKDRLVLGPAEFDILQHSHANETLFQR